ncbi:prolactin-releasing peptide receptor-like [Mytilus edulis]|uniref:prolactin-releasing peptide receptor-like n=1 Tax=Mytilus edulis TaxID=6550 RepID=UPI0039F0648C
MALVDAEETYIELIFKFFQDNNETDNVDFTRPHVRPSLRYVYPMFMFLHAVIGIAGFVGNIGILFIIGKHRLYRDQTHFFLGNIAFADIIKCVVVLPITLANLLIHNWIFGSFLCFFLPMIQCFPIHASMLTYLMIAIDRYRFIVTPFKTRAPTGLCIIGVWVAAVCVVLPYAVYIKFIDLGAILGYRFEGVGICYVNQERHIEEYIRAMFVTMYAMPLAVIGFLCVKVSAELKMLETRPMYSVHYSSNTNSSQVTWPEQNGNVKNDSSTASNEYKPKHTYHGNNNQDTDDDIDVDKEKRTQNYIITMVTLFAMCWCPLNILILVQYFVHENGDNTGHFDITYITFTWFGFLSTCTNPVLFASCHMSDSTKDRLKGYFRFSTRGKQKPARRGKPDQRESFEFEHRVESRPIRVDSV